MLTVKSYTLDAFKHWTREPLYIKVTDPLVSGVKCLPVAQETEVQSQVESYKKNHTKKSYKNIPGWIIQKNHTKKSQVESLKKIVLDKGGIKYNFNKLTEILWHFCE